MCVHKKLRMKRLATILIREITRRCNLRDFWQAIFGNGGQVMKTPMSSAAYWHRNLNPQKLVDIGFAFVPPEMNKGKFYKMLKVPDETVTPDLKPMTPEDVPKVTIALNQHLITSYKVHQVFTEDDVLHLLCPRDGLFYAWYVEDDSGVTDFISFYALNNEIIGDERYDKIYTANGFYNFVKDNDPIRLKQLMSDLLILCRSNNFDMFNMTEVLQNSKLRGDLHMRSGSTMLAHYLFNWRM